MHVMGRLPVFSLSIFLVLLQLLAHGTSQESSSDFIDAESLANYCIDSKNHKSAPGPEDELHSQVADFVNFLSVRYCLILIFPL